MTADWLLLGVEAEKNRSVAFTGHQDYDGRADGILRAVVYRLWSEGFRFFLSGMACGFDLAAAEAVLAPRGGGAGQRPPGCRTLRVGGLAAGFFAKPTIYN